MATQSQKDPEFYKAYTSAEIHQFETILRLIHSSEPNVSLAKQMVEDFSDNRQLQRFKDFKKSYEAALMLSQKKVDQYAKNLGELKQSDEALNHKKNALVHSQVQHTSSELKNRKASRLRGSHENLHSKKPKP